MDSALLEWPICAGTQHACASYNFQRRIYCVGERFLGESCSGERSWLTSLGRSPLHVGIHRFGMVRLEAGQFTPLRACTQDPQNSVEYRSGVLPRTTSTIGAPLGSQDRFDQLPLGIAGFPSSTHTLLPPVSYAQKIAELVQRSL
jgi:hypothetical protein